MTRYLLILLGLCLPLHAVTHYIAYDTGNNANDGLTKATAWKTWGNFNGIALTPGDRYIFKGGVTYPMQQMGTLVINSSGTAGNLVYFGVDPTWYVGASFTPPRFDAQNAEWTGGYDVGIQINGGNYIQIDDLDFLNACWQGVKPAGQDPGWICEISGCRGNVFSNNRFLGWSHGPSTTTPDNFACIRGSMSASPYDAGSVITNCVMDGYTVANSTDHQSSGIGISRFGGSVTNCLIRNLVNGYLTGQPSGTPDIGHNEIGPIYNSYDVNAHDNGLFVLYGGTWNIHDNFIHDTHSVCVYIGYSGDTTRWWNNVIWNNTQSAMFSVDTQVSGGSAYFWNNTLADTYGNGFWGIGKTAGHFFNVLSVINNHLIGSGYLTNFTGGATLNTFVYANSPRQTVGQANVQGYTVGNLWKPTSMNCVTIGAGQDGTAWNGGVLLADVLGTVRPQAQGWDVGAYEYANNVSPPGSVGLSTIAASFPMVGGVATVTLVRYGGTGGAVTATATTANGTATAPTDYTTTSYTANWADGATGARSFQIVLPNSGKTGNPLTFTVSITTTTGGLLVGSPSMETISITLPPPPTPYVESITSVNPASGVPITVSPPDLNNASSGSTAFTRSYANGTSLTLTAPATVGANTFTKWQQDGADLSVNPSITVTVGANHTFTAIYGSPPPPTVYQLTVNSSPSGAAVTVSPADNGGLSNGTTTFSRNYNTGTTVNLTSPASGFTKWQRDGVDYALTPATSLTMLAPHVMTAFYALTNGGVIQFVSPSYPTTELAGSVTLTVTRTGSINVASSVDFATANGTAAAGLDYTATSGTLNWAANANTAQPITVPILNSGSFGPNRYFRVNLSNPTGGATLGLNQAIVSISMSVPITVTSTVTIGHVTVGGTNTFGGR